MFEMHALSERVRFILIEFDLRQIMFKININVCNKVTLKPSNTHIHRHCTMKGMLKICYEHPLPLRLSYTKM
uniref:Uncharacterized protein n=1 Tax=Papilio polytes TaxID=76194 RepID=I4DSD9_PAPPL|nr:unknown unsecreted protein [Papilio polytes]